MSRLWRGSATTAAGAAKSATAKAAMSGGRRSRSEATGGGRGRRRRRAATSPGQRALRRATVAWATVVGSVMPLSIHSPPSVRPGPKVPPTTADGPSPRAPARRGRGGRAVVLGPSISWGSAAGDVPFEHRSGALAGSQLAAAAVAGGAGRHVVEPVTLGRRLRPLRLGRADAVVGDRDGQVVALDSRRSGARCRARRRLRLRPGRRDLQDLDRRSGQLTRTGADQRSWALRIAGPDTARPMAPSHAAPTRRLDGAVRTFDSVRGHIVQRRCVHE